MGDFSAVLKAGKGQILLSEEIDEMGIPGVKLTVRTETGLSAGVLLPSYVACSLARTLTVLTRT